MYNIFMQKIIKLLSILLIACIFQASGYFGKKPDLNDYFKTERQSITPVRFLDIEKTPAGKKAKTNIEELKKQLAPANRTNEQTKFLRKGNKPEFFDDVLFVLSFVERMKEITLKTDNPQEFAACANIQKFYFDDFLAKYKNTPDRLNDIYRNLRDINAYAQAISEQWNSSHANLKYISYSSYNGAYQPAIIKEKLIILDKKLDNLINLMKSLE